MAGTEFGGRIRLQGESEYRAALKEINSELKLYAAQMEANGKSAEGFAKKQELLNKKVEEQKKHIKELETALNAAKAKYGENSAEASKWQTKLNNAKTALVSMEKELAEASNKTKQFAEGFKAAATKLTDLGQRLQGLSTAAAGGLAAITGIAVKAGVAADDLNTLSSITGMSTESLQKFAYASDLIDVSQETLTGSLKKLTKNMAAAQQGTKAQAEAFKTLGVSVASADGSLRNNETVFYELIDALGAVKNETERDALAMTVFGKSATELNPLIDAGSQTLRDLGQEAKDAGLILSQDALDGLNQFNDGIDRLKAAANADLSRIGAKLVPTLEPILKDITEGLDKVVTWLTSLDEKTVETGLKITAFVAVLAPLITGLGQAVTAISTLVTVSGAVAASFGTIAGVAALLAAPLAAVGVAAYASAKHEAYLRGENGKLLDSMDDIADKYDKQIKQTDDAANAQIGQAKSAEKLLPKLEELASKTERTAEEDKQYHSVVEQLNTSIPNLNLAIDENTGKLNKNVSEVRNAIKAYKDLATATAYKDKLQAATSAQIDFKDDLLEHGKTAYQSYSEYMRSHSGENSAQYQKLWGKYAVAANAGKAVSYSALEKALSDAGGAKWADDKGVHDLLNYALQYETYKGYGDNIDEYASKLAELGDVAEKTGEKVKTVTTGGKEETDLEQFKKARKDIDYQHDMGVYNDEQYYKKLGELRDTYLTNDSDEWRGVNVELKKYNDSLADSTKKTEDGTKAATKATSELAQSTAKTTEELYAQSLADLQYYRDMGIITEREYYDRLGKLRDKYLATGSSEWRQATLEIKRHNDEIAKAAYNAQQDISFNWIDERVKLGDWDSFGTNADESYQRIYDRAKEALEKGILTPDELIELLDKINSEKAADYRTEQDKSKNWIADRNFYKDWNDFGTTESESYKRMLDRADEYYRKGILSYSEYLDEVRELNKDIYTAQADEQEEIYNAADERLTKALADRKAEMDAQISALNKQVSDLRDKYTVENRNKELSELQAEARIYRSAGTLAGQEKYKQLTEQIEKLQQEAELEALERKNNEIIAKLQQDYEIMESTKTDLLTQIKDNTADFNPQSVAEAISAAFTAIMPSLVNKVVEQRNITNNATTNVVQNNTVTDSVDAVAIINDFVKSL